MRFKLSVILFIFVLAALLNACYPTRNVPNGEYLLLNNNYKITQGSIIKHNIPAYILQKPNKRILTFRFYLRAYNLGTMFKEGSLINKILTQNIGEAPAIYDSLLLEKSGANIKKHLNNLGYYNSSVYAEIKTNKILRTVKVNYLIEAGQPYILRNINYTIAEANIKRYVQADLAKTFLKKGNNFTVDEIIKERDRITEDLNNDGFYYFISNQINFTADTNLMTHEVDLNMIISPLKSKEQFQDSAIFIKDKQFIINDLYILYNISKNDLGKEGTDTTDVITDDFNNKAYLYHFIHKDKIDIKPKTIINAFFVKPNNIYKKNDIIETYKALTSYSTFRYINIELIDVSNSESEKGKLDCYINILRDKKFSITSESEVKNTGGDFGLAQNFGFRSLNTFKNAEILNLNFNGAMEMQAVSNSPSTSKWPFNVYESGVNMSLDFPKFINPIKSQKPSRYIRPKTKITLGYNFQQRPDYTRYITNGSLGYTWQPLDKISHGVKLLEASSVKIFPAASFKQIIDGYSDLRIKYSYQNHIVLSSSYNFNYNEHRFKGLSPFKYLYSKIEVGGIPWNLIGSINPSVLDSLGQRHIFGLPLSQYVLFVNDARYYLPIGKNIMNVFRSNFGIGIPLGTTKALPFEKSFYIGGANSLRAWTIGTLGPGSYKTNNNSFETTGDIKIEFSYELRFSISGNFEGALFTDVGNIWLINKSDANPGGHFVFPDFLQQFAVDFGYGIRYDLEFLIIRIDLAHPIYQPYLPNSSRWTALNTKGKLITGFNFAIGYPF